jgi:hypothetical protein
VSKWAIACVLLCGIVHAADSGLLVVKAGGKYGFIDRSGALAIAPKYDMVLAGSADNGQLLGVSIQGKWGFVDRSGKMAIEPRFDVVQPFENGLGKAQLNNKWGLIDTAGKFVIQPQWDAVGDPCEGMVRVGLDVSGEHRGSYVRYTWGYANSEGKIVVQPTYSRVWDFKNGVALVNKGGHWNRSYYYDMPGGGSDRIIGGEWSRIDKTGKVVAGPVQFLDTDERSRVAKQAPGEPMLDEGLCPALSGGKWGYIDGDWQVKIPCVWPGAGRFSEGLATVPRGPDPKGQFTYGFINTKGQVVIEPKFAYAAPFRDGLALVATMVGKEQMWGVIDKMGKFVVEPVYRGLGALGGSLWQGYTRDGKTIMFDTSGKVIMTCHNLVTLGHGRVVVTDMVDRKQTWWLSDLSGRRLATLEGLAVRLGEGLLLSQRQLEGPRAGEVGLMDDDGKEILPCEYAQIVPEPGGATGRFLVCKGNKWGIVGRDGKFILPLEYEDLAILSDELMGIKQAGRWGLAKRATGQIICPPRYAHLDHKFGEGLMAARLEVGGPLGYIDAAGKVVIEPRFGMAGLFQGGLASVEIDGVGTWIDTSGKVLWKP